MAQALALTRKPILAAQAHSADLLRGVIVFACAAALIFAGQPLPV